MAGLLSGKAFLCKRNMREFDSPPGLKKLTGSEFRGESKDGVRLGWDPNARPVIVLYKR